MMVLIISDEYDESTNQVIDWLQSYNTKFIRINDTSIIRIIRLEISNADTIVELEINQQRINLNNIGAVWYRRGDLNFRKFIIESANIELSDVLYHSGYCEVERIRDFLYFILSKKRNINIKNNNINKLIILNCVKQFGLYIPSTLITSSRNQLGAFMENQGSVITKPIYESPSYADDSGEMKAFVSVIQKEFLDEINDDFFVSLFQKNYIKKYELRIFFLNDLFYSMAIFSNQNLKAKIDSRNIDNKNRNRCVPYKLPYEVECKLYNCMKYLGINSGSIDMIVTNCGDYIFLEVNPIGQYEMVSYPCNYAISKQIAKFLSNATY